MSWIADILLLLAAVLAFLLLLVLWVILVPRHFWVEYCKTDGLIVQVNLAFFKITLFPLPSFMKKGKEEKEPQAKEEKETLDDSGEKDGGKAKEPALPEFSFQLVKDILGAAKGVMKRILKAIKFSHVSFTVPVYGGRPEETQKKYAGITSAFYTFNIFLQQFVQIYYEKPIFVADFANLHSKSLYFYCKISASPILLLSAGLFAFRQYRRIMATAGGRGKDKEN